MGKQLMLSNVCIFVMWDLGLGYEGMLKQICLLCLFCVSLLE